MTKRPSNLGASAQTRLLQLSRTRNADYQLVLLRYANERLLYRLAISPYAKLFVLKGAALLTAWTGHPHRATRDLDLLGYGDPSIIQLRSAFYDILSATTVDDGVVYQTATLKVAPIRATQKYGGFCVTLTARIGTARVKLQVDIGFGDVITPDASEIAFPTLLDDPPPMLQAYPRETVIAEKLEAMVSLGLANSRMKDFYDVAFMAEIFSFDGALLITAIRATFSRRGTPLPSQIPTALLPSFTQETAKIAQWTAFLRKSGLKDAPKFFTIVDQVKRFVLLPLTQATATGSAWVASWPPRGPWQTPKA